MSRPYRHPFIEKTLGRRPEIDHLPALAEERILALVATDICRRQFFLEWEIRANRDPECFSILDAIFESILEGTRTVRIDDIGDRIERACSDLADADERQVLYGALHQLLDPSPGEAADRARFHLMIHLGRYGSPFADQKGKRESDWIERRLKWWLTDGHRSKNPWLWYEDEEVRVPEEVRHSFGLSR
jgi:hypothetical protein